MRPGRWPAFAAPSAQRAGELIPSLLENREKVIDSPQNLILPLPGLGKITAYFQVLQHGQPGEHSSPLGNHGDAWATAW